MDLMKSFAAKPTEENYDMAVDIELIINSKLTGQLIKPLVTDNIEVAFERKGSPGKLSFKMIFDENVQEGDQVSLRYKNEDFFLGYIFVRKFDKNDVVSITCYDQIRYLKNKAYYVHKTVTASQILQNVAKDFNLQLGEIEDTVHVFEKRREDGTVLLDQIQGALTETLRLTGKRFVLFDAYGKLCIKETENLKIKELVFDEKSAQNYDFEVSIDKNTYNKVVLDYVNEEAKKLDKYVVLDSKNISKWGVLQYFEKIDKQNVSTESERIKRAEQMLKYYNSRTKDFKLKGVFGDIRVRGGSSFTVMMNVAEFKLANYMLVDKVIHKFGYKEYFMDLDLEGQIGEEESNDVNNSTSSEEYSTE